MNYGSLVPSFYFYKFAESISQPYTSFAAYRAGAIDANGNLVKPESSIDPYEYFIIKLKKIFEQLPPGLTKYQLANYTSALNYFAEEAEKFNIEKEHYIALVEGILAAQCGPEASYIELLEDMSAGGMAVAGDSAGYNTGGVSGFDPVMAPMQRRKPVTDEMFHMFDVSDNDFSKISNNQMNDIEYLRRFGIRNPDSTLIVRNSKDGNLYTVPKKKKLKEEYNLDFLFEESAVADYTDKTTDKDKNVAVLTNAQESNYDIPEHLHPKVADFISTSLNMKYRTKDNQDAGRIVDRKDSHSTELHARMLLFAGGLEDISKIPDTAKRHETFSNFINAVHVGRHKNPSVSDQRSKEKHPDAWAYHPEHGVIGAEIKTDRYEGSFPTKLSNTASSEQIEQEKQRNISNIQSQWKNGVVVQRKASGKFFKVSPENITGLWAEHPARIKSRKRGSSVRQENKETAGNVLKIKSLRSLTSKREDPLKISNQTIELLKQHTNAEHHDLLSGILGVHV